MSHGVAKARFQGIGRAVGLTIRRGKEQVEWTEEEIRHSVAQPAAHAPPPPSAPPPPPSAVPSAIDYACTAGSSSSCGCSCESLGEPSTAYQIELRVTE